MYMGKKLRRTKAILKRKNKAGVLPPPDFKTSYKVRLLKRVWFQWFSRTKQEDQMQTNTHTVN